MKYKYIVIVLTFLSSVTLADTTQNGQPILYCPHHIECFTDGKLDSCLLSDNFSEAWLNPTNFGRVIKGKYNLKKVNSIYQQSTPYSYWTRCNYSMTDSHGVEKLMEVGIKAGSNGPENNEYMFNHFEVYLSNISSWSVSGWDAECFSNDPHACPLIEHPEITYIATDKDMNDRGQLYWNESEYGTSTIFYDRLLDICGATSICKINIGKFDYKARKYERYGTVTLDIALPDVVKIVNIDTAPLSTCIIKKKEPFNTIYCDPKK